MRRSPRTRLLAASAVTLATLAFTACGGDDDDDSTGASDVTLSAAGAETTPADDTAGPATDPDDTVVGDTVAPDGTTPSSGGGEVGSQDEYVEAAKSEVAFADTDVNQCVAEAIVSDDVYAAIQDAGMSVETFQSDGPAGLGLEDSDAQAVADDLAACGDLLAQVLAGEGDIELQCAEDNITNEQVAEFLAFSLLDLEPSGEVTAANDAVDECIEAASTTTT